METMPINNNQCTQFHPVLFIPVVNAVSNNVYHDRTFWGIRFPVFTTSFHQTAIDIVKKYLEGRRDPVLQAPQQGFDLTVIMLAIVIEVDRKSVKHKVGF
jgi:hypothetical protein